VEVLAAARDLLVIRDPIAAARRCLAGKTPAHGGHVDALAKFVLGQAELLEPPEHGLAGRPRERLARGTFPYTGCLTDQHHRRHHRQPGDDRPDHLGAGVTPTQARDVALELDQRRHGRTMNHPYDTGTSGSVGEMR
jgi:hypothetical protein